MPTDAAALRAKLKMDFFGQTQVSPANKDRPGHRTTFAAKCAGCLKNGIGLIVVDTVTLRLADMHDELLRTLEIKPGRAYWKSASGLYAIAYRPVTVRKSPRIEIWTEPLAIGKALPTLPLWLTLELAVPVRLEDAYLATCQSLRISA